MDALDPEYICWLNLVETGNLEYAPAPNRPGRLTWRMLVLNLVGVGGHAGALILEAAMSVRTNMWVYTTNLEARRAVVGVEPNLTHRWDPVFQDASRIYITWLALSVHFMALASHTIVSASLMLSYSSRFHGASNWYLWGLYRCRAWWRWVEYFGSATAMVVFLAVVTGIREDEKVLALGVLCATTMLFGWMTEVHSSHLIESVPPPRPLGLGGWEYHYRWRPHTRTDRVVWHHLLGYLPFSFMFWWILDIFWANKEALKATDEEWPFFVDLSVYGSIVLFSMFGITQLAQQVHEYGPSWYWAGEASYVALSFTAKAFLIFLATFNALLPTSKFDDLIEAHFD